MPKISNSQNLINFIVPHHLVDCFDYVCAKKAQSRTSVLKRLMDEYVQEHAFLFPNEFIPENYPSNTNVQRTNITKQPRQLLTFKEWVKLDTETKENLKKK